MRVSSMSMLNCHQIEEFIDSYLDESLSWRRRTLFRSHLLMCRECRSYIGAYKRAIQQLRPDAEVLSQACPLFVPLAEEGWTEGEITRRPGRCLLAGDLDGQEQGYGRS